jgi:isoquinoline 1-oxidoreductase subunit alpha
MVELTVNGIAHHVDADPDTPLLWFLHHALALTGTRFGCGMGLCGCCTVHVNGKATRSCSITLNDLKGSSVMTIEQLSAEGMHPLQQAWIDLEVPQCGYCQSGQLMQAAALLSENPRPSDADIDAAMSGNICRCGTYPRIRAAIKQVAYGSGLFPARTSMRASLMRNGTCDNPCQHVPYTPVSANRRA